MGGGRSIPRDTLSEMVSLVDPGAHIRGADLAAGGHLSVYHLDIETSTGCREWVLKAPPDGDRHGIDTEARLLTLVQDRTSIPVPEVIGAADGHETLPAPFFVMAAAEGARLSKREMAGLPDTALERLAYQSGRYLADLHGVDGPDGYGQVDIRSTEALEGGRPAPDTDQLTITEVQGTASRVEDGWLPVVETWAADSLARLEHTRFADMAGEIRPVLLDRIASLEGPFEPVLGRIDHDLQNLLMDPDTGTITGMIDWAFTLSVPPAYDLVCVDSALTRGPWSVHPETPDRRAVVGPALLEGYREHGRSAVVDRVTEHGPAYALLARVRSMNHLALATEMTMPGATAAQVDATARAYRAIVSEFLP